MTSGSLLAALAFVTLAAVAPTVAVAGEVVTSTRSAELITCDSTVRLQIPDADDKVIARMQNAPTVAGGGPLVTAGRVGILPEQEAYIQLLGTKDDPCPRYKPIKKGQKLRLFANKAKAYVATSQSALSPLSGDDEEYGVFTVPAPTSDGKKTDMETMQSLETPDVVWQVSWPGDEEEWHPKTQVTLRHVATGMYLRVDPDFKFEDAEAGPIKDHFEVVASEEPSLLVEAGGGFYYVPHADVELKKAEEVKPETLKARLDALQKTVLELQLAVQALTGKALQGADVPRHNGSDEL